MGIAGLIAVGLGTVISLHPNTGGDSIAGLVIGGIGIVLLIANQNRGRSGRVK